MFLEGVGCLFFLLRLGDEAPLLFLGVVARLKSFPFPGVKAEADSLRE
jgi:hypothetical protein